jgi:XisH protein
MPKKDLYHSVVRECLEKEGWKITNDPYILKRTTRKPYEVDLAAEKVITAERGVEKIAVEIKSFLGSSLTYDFHNAFGQYNIYRFFMQTNDPNRKLFLAITDEAFHNFFSDEDVQAICDYFKVNLFIFNSTQKEIISWLEK